MPNEPDCVVEIPDDLLDWLEAEAARQKCDIESLIIEILETRRLFDKGTP